MIIGYHTGRMILRKNNHMYFYHLKKKLMKISLYLSTKKNSFIRLLISCSSKILFVLCYLWNINVKEFIKIKWRDINIDILD